MTQDVNSLPKTAKEAIEKNHYLYFTGKECKHNHLAPRYAKNRRCVKCTAQWQTDNRELYRQSSRKWNRTKRKQWLANKPNYHRDATNRRWNNDIRQRLLDSAKYSAKNRGLEINLTVDDIIIPTHCPILKCELIIPTYGEADGVRDKYTPSLDRINSDHGYVRGNVHVISWRANELKRNGTLEELIALGEWAKKQGSSPHQVGKPCCLTPAG